jgi:plastocyanin domain-containing protein
VTITVDGGYDPARIRVVAGKPLRLTFHRIDPSSCVAQVIFPDFQRRLDLPLEASTSIDLLPAKPGLYPFHCGMNMVRGMLEVVAAQPNTA